MDVSRAKRSRLMQELTEIELMNKISEAQHAFAVFVYSPFCGTCKLAERMLHIVIEVESVMPVYRVNINLVKWSMRKWQISSVPCILIFENHVLREARYALRDVNVLYQLLKSE